MPVANPRFPRRPREVLRFVFLYGVLLWGGFMWLLFGVLTIWANNRLVDQGILPAEVLLRTNATIMAKTLPFTLGCGALTALLTWSGVWVWEKWASR